MNFGEALELMKQGRKLYRGTWNGKGIFASAYYPEEGDFFDYPFLYFDNSGLNNNNSGFMKRIPWIPTQADLMNEDWELFDEEEQETAEEIKEEVETNSVALIRAFKFSQKWEGGSLYTDDPRDSGGPTKYGIALNHSKEWVPDKNRDGKIDKEDIKLLEEVDALYIYKHKYWLAFKCDKMPPAVGFVYVDMCFNMGGGASAKILQRCLNKFKGINLVVDGKVGNKTIEAAFIVNERQLVLQLCGDREAYYRSLKQFSIYGKGWLNRAKDCEKEALQLC